MAHKSIPVCRRCLKFVEPGGCACVTPDPVDPATLARVPGPRKSNNTTNRSAT